MKKIDFIKALMKNPGSVGALIPSSKFLAEKMAELSDLKDARCVIEFGAGTGVITKKILSEMPLNSILFCFEIDKDLVKILNKNIKDDRVRIIHDSAENFPKYIPESCSECVDRIISGLPLALLSKEVRIRILKLSEKHLKDDGIFVQFQYSLANLSDFKKLFPSITINFELLNIPPAFIYVCKKILRASKKKIEFNIPGDVELSRKLALEKISNDEN